MYFGEYNPLFGREGGISEAGDSQPCECLWSEHIRFDGEEYHDVMASSVPRDVAFARQLFFEKQSWITVPLNLG